MISYKMNLVFTIAITIGLVLQSVGTSTVNRDLLTKSNIQEKIELSNDSTIVYQTSNLVIKKISDHVYLHISYLNTDEFGKVGCNGMLVISDGEGVVFDSPTNNQSSKELIQFVNRKLMSDIKAFVPTHFHQDCVGGLEEFQNNYIPTYASKQTLALLKKNGQTFTLPVKSFNRNLNLNIGNYKVYAEYFGQGHTKDNIIGYFPLEDVIFGGCLIKEIGAGKGYLGDANSQQWSKTVEKIKSKYPHVKLVIPGHGQLGGSDLIDYTINLFAN